MGQSTEGYLVYGFPLLDKEDETVDYTGLYRTFKGYSGAEWENEKKPEILKYSVEHDLHLEDVDEDELFDPSNIEEFNWRNTLNPSAKQPFDYQTCSGFEGSLVVYVTISEEWAMDGGPHKVDLNILSLKGNEYRILVDNLIQKYKLNIKPDDIGWYVTAKYG